MRYSCIVRISVLAIATLVVLAAPALACPPRDACVVNLNATVRDSVRPAATVETVSRALRLPVVNKPGAAESTEVPPFWRVLRDRVYSRMPTYRDSNELKVVFAPVVVTSPSDTVPGLGIAGDF